MKLIEQAKFAVYIGSLVGLFIGLVDVLSKLINGFEWFELYQALAISLIISLILFSLLGFFIAVISTLIKIKIKKQGVYLFYFASVISFLILFYGCSIINNFIAPRYYYQLDLPKLNLLVLVIALLIWIIFLISGKNISKRTVSFLSRNWMKKIMLNLIFLIIIFIIISLFMDIYLLNHIPSYSSNKNIDKPNIILITLDTVRADHLSLYGYKLLTSPNLDKLAEKSVVFENAIAPAPSTLPSHSSLFTGKYPGNHNAHKRHQLLVYSEVTLAEILKEAGYNTAGFISGPFCKAKYGLGQGFDLYKDRLDFLEHSHVFNKLNLREWSISFPNKMIDLIVKPKKKDLLEKNDLKKVKENKTNTFGAVRKALNIILTGMQDGEKNSKETNQDVIEWTRRNKESPFFVFINYFDAHAPYNLGKEYRHQFTNKTIDYQELKRVYTFRKQRHKYFTEEVVDYVSKIYDAEIFYLDKNLGKLFERLQEFDLMDNTILIITADHGEEFYEHGRFEHGLTLYEEIIHVPLIIYYPKMFESQRIDKKVGIINLFPTILEIVGMSTPENIDSVSLLSLIKNGSGYNRDYVLSELIARFYLGENEQRALSYQNWKLTDVHSKENVMYHYDVPSGLFDLENDPKEQKSLYDINTKKRDDMLSHLLEILEK